jgi:hypothetical protein
MGVSGVTSTEQPSAPEDVKGDKVNPYVGKKPCGDWVIALSYVWPGLVRAQLH